MKIWHQSMADFDQLQTYRKSLGKHALAVCEEGTEVVVKGMPKRYVEGITTTELLGSPYIYHVAFRRIIEYAREAERDGYDAFVIGSFSEPFLREIRSAVDIPVASVGESNFLLACSYGKFQAHIANVPTVARLVSDHVHEYRLTDRVVAVYAIGPEMDEFLLQDIWATPKKAIDRFTDLAKQAISEGADVIIPVEGVMSELLYTNGINRIGDAPVFDSFGMVWKYAELLVHLREKMNITVGREWEYARASEAKMAGVRKSHGIDDGAGSPVTPAPNSRSRSGPCSARSNRNG